MHNLSCHIKRDFGCKHQTLTAFLSPANNKQRAMHSNHLPSFPACKQAGHASVLLLLLTQVAYFVNSGSEANDMAILLARLYTGNHDLIALRNGYHGITEGLLGVLGHSTWKYNVPSVRCCWC